MTEPPFDSDDQDDQPSLHSKSQLSASQYSIASILWTMLTLSLVFGYVRTLQSSSAFVGLLAVVGLAIVVGGLLGVVSGRVRAGAFWAVVIGVSGYLSVMGEVNEGPSFRFAWTSLGILTGGVSGSIPAGRPIARVVGAGTIATILIGIIAMSSNRLSSTPIFELFCAPIVGCLVGGLISLLDVVEKRYRIRQYITACWLLSAVVVGNLAVSWLL